MLQFSQVKKRKEVNGVDDDPLKGLRWPFWFIVGAFVGFVLMKATIL